MKRLPIFFAALLVSCALLGVSTTSARSAPFEQAGPIIVTVVADKAVYDRGESVRFTLSIMNTTSESVTRTMPGGQDYDLIVRTLDGSEVWRWSRSRVFTDAIREVSFGPGQTKTYSEIWDQRTNTGQQVGPGSYVVLGIHSSSPDVRSSLVGFSVVTPLSTVTPTATTTPTPAPPSRNQWLSRPPSGSDATPTCPSSGLWQLLYWGGADSTPIAGASEGCTTITLLSLPPQYVCGDGTRATEASRCSEADLYWVNRSGRWLGYSKITPDVSDTWSVARGEAHFLHGKR
jgi:hypothetical protein